MSKTIGAVLLLALAGCAGMAPYRPVVSACALGETTYECQVERYHNVNVQ
jgi:hypothetical protein